MFGTFGDIGEVSDQFKRKTSSNLFHSLTFTFFALEYDHTKKI